MRHITTRLAALAAGCLLAMPAFLSAQTPLPEPFVHVGDPAGQQISGAAHHAADGSALVLWEEAGTDGSQLMARRHRGWTTPTTPLIQVSGQPQFPMEIALDAVDGAGWVAAWDHYLVDDMQHVIRARDFDATDVAASAEYQVNTLPGRHWHPDVDYSADGTRAFVWTGATSAESGEAVYARVFRADGAMPQEVQLSIDPVWTPEPPQIVRLASGIFLAVWAGQVDNGANEEIFARRFDDQGNLVGPPFQISESGGSYENSPSLAIDATGLPAVAWVARPELRLRTLDAFGYPQGPVLQVERAPDEWLDEPAITRDADGDIALAFVASSDFGPGPRAWLQRFGADGTPSPRQLLNEYTPDAWQSAPTVSSDVDGDVYATWQSSEWNYTTGENIRRVGLRHLRGANVADLSLSFTDNKTSVATGDTQIYVARVRHEGTPTGVPGEGDTSMISVNVTLPEHATLEGIHQMDWTCHSSTQYSPHSVYCLFDRRSLAPGEQTYPVVVYARAASWASEVTATAEIGTVRHPDPNPANDTGSDSTWIGDVEPAPFPILERSNVPRWSVQESDPFFPSGITVPVEITVSGGEYRIDDGPWTSEPGVFHPGRQLRLRHTASSEFSTLDRTWYYVGTRSGTFETLTEARDNLANPFAFVDLADVARGVTVESNLVTITGINDATPISVSGGSFSINGGTWRTHPGYAYNGDVVKVQHVAASAHGTRTDTVLTVGTVSDIFSSTTVAADTTPDPYSFSPQSNVPRSTQVTSASVMITGIDAATPISVSGGSYSVSGAPFTTAPGIVYPNDNVRVQHLSASGFSMQTVTTLSIGGVQAAFASTTAAADGTPDAFAFAAASGVARSSTVTSGAIAVSGIDTAAAISVAGGSYSVNGAAFTTAAGTVNAGDQVRVQHVASAAFGTATTTTLTIGGVAGGFTSTTETADTTPNAFAFVDVTAKKNKAVTSSPVTISGINTAAPITVSGGGAKWSKNGGAFTTAAGTVANGDVVRLQVVAPFSAGSKVNVIVNVGGVTDTWTVTAVN